MSSWHPSALSSAPWYDPDSHRPEVSASLLWGLGTSSLNIPRCTCGGVLGLKVVEMLLESGVEMGDDIVVDLLVEELGDRGEVEEDRDVEERADVVG